MVSKTRRAEVLTLWSGEMRQLVTGPYFKMVSKVRVAPRATQVIDVCGSMGAARTKRMSQEGKERRKTSNGDPSIPFSLVRCHGGIQLFADSISTGLGGIDQPTQVTAAGQRRFQFVRF